MAENNQANAPAQEQDLSEILKVRREKLAALRAEGRDPFQQTRFDVSHHAQDIKDHFDELEGTEVTVGGRLMSKRGMGKVSFCDLQDKSGRIQIYARKDEMDEEAYDRFNYACEPELIEASIFEINALKAKYDYLLRCVKERAGMSANRGAAAAAQENCVAASAMKGGGACRS